MIHDGDVSGRKIQPGEITTAELVHLDHVECQRCAHAYGEHGGPHSPGGPCPCGCSGFRWVPPESDRPTYGAQ